MGPKLKAAAKEAEGVDWRTHLDACRKSREAVATKFPDVRSALDRIGREAKDADRRAVGVCERGDGE